MLIHIMGYQQILVRLSSSLVLYVEAICALHAGDSYIEDIWIQDVC